MDHWLPNIISTAALVLAFYGANRKTRDKAEQNAARLQAIETKVDLIYEWFQGHVVNRASSAGAD